MLELGMSQMINAKTLTTGVAHLYVSGAQHTKEDLSD